MTTQANLVEAALNATETTETSLGNITVPLGAKKIVGVYGTANVLTTTAELASGKFRFTQGQQAGVWTFPLTIHQGPAGTLASPGWAASHQIIPVDIPCRENDTMTFFATLNVAQTGNCRAQCGVIFE